MKARSAKAKGTRLEKWAATQLQKLGVDSARRQPGSGIYSDFAHDVFGVLPDGTRFTVECKARREAAWKTGDRWLGKADLLLVKLDDQTERNERGQFVSIPQEPRIYMSWGFFARLMELATGD